MLISLCDGCRKRRVLFSVGHGVEYCMACRRAEQRVAAGGGDKFVNQHGKESGQRNTFPGKRVGPLAANDKARICILAAEAFEHLHGREGSAEELEAWRHEQQRRACGVSSLRVATQAQRDELVAHFLNLKGESVKAFEVHMKPEAERHRVALAVLRRDLRKGGFVEKYAATICWSKYEKTLTEASADQVWTVVFDIRKRTLKKAAKDARPRTMNLPF